MKSFFPILFCALITLQCSNDSKAKNKPAANNSDNSTTATDTARKKINSAETILKKQQVPVLCYHHIEDWQPKEKSSLKLLLVPVEHFKEQIKSLSDSGYHTITPD